MARDPPAPHRGAMVMRSDHLSSPPSVVERKPAGSLLDGWSFTILIGAAIAAVAGVVLVVGAASPEAIGRALRFTARASFALFCAAFTATAAHRLWPGRFTRWQRRNRRYLGVAFAASHLAHGAAIIALATLAPAAFHEHTQRSNPIPGLIGYGFLLAMTATSFDRTAAWLGARRWRVLHTVGAFYLWATFLVAFLTRALRMPGYWLPTALVVAALALRVVAWRRRKVGA